jgi:membrane-bound metal-dependent hydrolase YbcI (DUF457 family)
MDLITHVLIAYLTSFAIFGHSATNYIAAAALAGGLPDGDVVFFPLYRYFPILRHHGITHSFVGVTVIALVGAFLATFIVPGTYILFFLAMELGGLIHIGLDGFTNFAVPPLSPFSNKKLHMDADVAVNVFTMSFSIGAFLLLLAEKGTVSLSVWTTTVWIFLGIYLAYLLFRGTARLFVSRLKKIKNYKDVIPTLNPFYWIFVDEKNTKSAYTVTYRKYKVFKGFFGKAAKLSINSGIIKNKKTLSIKDIISKTYLTAMHSMGFIRETYKFVNFKKIGSEYEIFWFSPEFMTVNRSFGVILRVSDSGKIIETKNAMRKVYI